MSTTIDLEPIRLNFTVVGLPSGRIYFSYSTPVALVIFDGGRKVRTTTRHSATTAKHLGTYCKEFEPVDPEQFAALLEQIA